MVFFENIQNILRQDIGNRGFVSAVPPTDMRKLAATLNEAERVILLSGFPVRDINGKPCGETDGPLGTANMAQAFIAAGCEVSIVTDDISYRIMRAAVDYRAPKAELIRLPKYRSATFCRRLMSEIKPTHLITLERPGKAEDGHFHNMRGEIIDDMVCDTDMLLPLAKEWGAITISVGDGGNEAGMGNYRREIIENVPLGKQISAVYPSDYTLVTGVSNWWGWGIAALLSRIKGENFLPTKEEETQMLAEILKAGAVDGCTGEKEMSVDNLSLDVHLDILEALNFETNRAIEETNFANI